MVKVILVEPLILPSGEIKAQKGEEAFPGTHSARGRLGVRPRSLASRTSTLSHCLTTGWEEKLSQCSCICLSFSFTWRAVFIPPRVPPPTCKPQILPSTLEQLGHNLPLLLWVTLATRSCSCRTVGVGLKLHVLCHHPVRPRGVL